MTSKTPEATATSPLTHFDAQGQAHMVDVGAKAATHRIAVATGRIEMKPETLALVESGCRTERAETENGPKEPVDVNVRSDERRGGKECVSTC